MLSDGASLAILAFFAHSAFILLPIPYISQAWVSSSAFFASFPPLPAKSRSTKCSNSSISAGLRELMLLGPFGSKNDSGLVVAPSELPPRTPLMAVPTTLPPMIYRLKSLMVEILLSPISLTCLALKYGKNFLK